MSRNPSFISNSNFHTYVVLREGASPQGLEAKFPAAIKNIQPRNWRRDLVNLMKCGWRQI
jgi:hypothetical protein